MNKREIGSFYENEVCDFLVSKGIEIIDRNYFCKFGEVDIIGREGDTLIFFEVKYRSSNRYGNPLEAIDIRKQKRIINCARFYTAYKYADLFIRFDAVGVIGKEIEWIKNAFWM